MQSRVGAREVSLAKRRTIRDYHVEVINDELIVMDDDGCLVSYNPKSKESQRVQEALFHEKQVIIENCLFGVDINENSVKICRLRLWIELLKHAYYKEGIEPEALETLPNIDINIKCGNSLISRFSFDASLGAVLKKSKRTVSDYRDAVRSYHQAIDKSQKRELEVLLGDIKRDFSASISVHALNSVKEELRNLENQHTLFEEDATKKAQVARKKRDLTDKIKDLEKYVETTVAGTLYQNAFEWRFEFPEILSPSGDYVGFDVVIGNPPYGVSVTNQARDAVVSRLGQAPDFEIYYFFINLAYQLVRSGGGVSLIIPNTFLFNVNAAAYRATLLERWKIDEIVDCTDFVVFSEATVRNAILLLSKGNAGEVIGYKPTDSAGSITELLGRTTAETTKETLLDNNQNWALVFRRPASVLRLVSKIRAGATRLEEFFPEISQGLIAYDKYRGQSSEIIKSRAYHSDKKLDDSYKEWLWGEDVTRYAVRWNQQEFIKYGEGIANPRQPKFFREPRILVREITSPQIYAAFTDTEQYNDPAIINILDSKNNMISIHCLLGILNSTLATFYHINSSPKITKGAFPKILVTDIKNFPLPKVIKRQLEANITSLTKQTIETRRKDSHTSITDIEQRIDNLVYELYGLSSDEIGIIDKQLSAYDGGHPS